MSPRNRETYVAQKDADADKLRAVAAWQYGRRHITRGVGEVCEWVKALRDADTCEVAS